MTEITRYPEAGSHDGSGSELTVDGVTRRSDNVGGSAATDEDWDDCREASEGNQDMDDAGDPNYWGNSDDWFYGSSYYVDVYRSIALFDTSDIGSATVSAATCSLYLTSVYDKDAGDEAYISLVESDPVSNTEITITTDYVRVGLAGIGGSFSLGSATELHTADGGADTTTTQGNRYDLSIGTTDGQATPNKYVDWTMDATGRGAVSTSGITKLGFRHGHDLEGHPNIHTPSASNAASIYSLIYGNTADATGGAGGTDNDPKLVVTYTPITTDIDNVNGVAYASIQAVNGITAANGQAINGVDF